MTWRLRSAAHCVAAGGIIAYPTEGVFGLGCDPFSAAACYRIIDLKQRDVRQGLIVIGADLAQLRPFCADLQAAETKRLEDSWPGHVTWTVPASGLVPGWVSGGRDTVALRVPAHRLARELCAVAGPLVSTSANPTGCPPARTVARARAYFGGQIDAYLAGRCPDESGRPSQIRDLRTGEALRA